MSTQYAQCERHCEGCDRLAACERPEAVDERREQAMEYHPLDPLATMEAQIRGLYAELADLQASVRQLERFRDDLRAWMQNYGREDE